RRSSVPRNRRRASPAGHAADPASDRTRRWRWVVSIWRPGERRVMPQGKDRSWCFLGRSHESHWLRCDFTDRTAAPSADQAGLTVKVEKSMTWNSAQLFNSEGTQWFPRPANYLEP